jgi:hypothetical protein
LLRDQGKRADARDLLEPVFAWFTKGFERAPRRTVSASGRFSKKPPETESG